MVTVVGVAAGEAAVTVTATDPGDLSATQMFDVTVAVGNQSPQAVGTITGLAIAVGATEAVDVSGNFSDADGDDAHVHGRLLGRCVRHGLGRRLDGHGRRCRRGGGGRNRHGHRSR